METAQRIAVRPRSRPRELFYITHIDNVQSILKNGILSHELVLKKGIEYKRIYNKEVVEKRKEIRVSGNRRLWSLANLYFTARNPMLFKLKCDGLLDEIAVLGVSPDILQRDDIFVTDGNAACDSSRIMPISKARKELPRILRETDREYWGEKDGSKRKIMAECLVPDLVDAVNIKSIYTATPDSQAKVTHALAHTRASYGVMTSPEPWMFFKPSVIGTLRSTSISLMQGDMFFSRMQTLTISVNTVGVMGKGVASRAKHQFPDVFAKYHEVCQNGKLKMGKPYLFKREYSADIELADEPSTLRTANSQTWFLFFATKRHWRDDADIRGIEEGLQWLCENYQKEGIKELALPALGCGLGRLEWKNVGPLLCRYLSRLKIPVSIYLPLEDIPPKELLTTEYLLPSGKAFAL